MTKHDELFSNLIIEYRSQLYRIAYGILKSCADAEDAVSETTCKAYSNFHKLRDITKFKPWVIRILINEAYSIANKRKRTLFLDEDIPIDHADKEIIERITLWNAVQRLNDKYKIIVILFYYEDLSIKEISKLLHIPIGTVNSRLNRSRHKLKEIY